MRVASPSSFSGARVLRAECVFSICRAIRISAQRFSDRFEREARSIAALNHSNICTLFDVGPNYLVKELVEGATLTERIAQGPMSDQSIPDDRGGRG
jgi:serine/threonine protein kinase